MRFVFISSEHEYRRTYHVHVQSSEIIRMFYTEFDDIIHDKYRSVDLFPEKLRAEIEGTNDWTYNDINNGVYKSGFATYARFPFRAFSCSRLQDFRPLAYDL